MGKEVKIRIEKPRGHYCFACGTANPIGLNLQFYRIGDDICSDITLDRVYEGWQNMAHGGIISALVDEVMSWAVMYSKKIFLVTRKMKIKYVKPVLIGVPLTVRGTVVDSSQTPKIKAKAEIRDNKASLLVKSSAEFIELPAESLSSVPQGMKEEMLSLFRRLA